MTTNPVDDEFKPGITVRRALELWEKFWRTEIDPETAVAHTVDVRDQQILATFTVDGAQVQEPLATVTYRPDQYLDLATRNHKFTRCYVMDIADDSGTVREQHHTALPVTLSFLYEPRPLEG